MFGSLNYGDIPLLINAADDDPWDVLVPGLPDTLPIGTYVIDDLLGYVHVENGNHKLCIRITDANYDEDRARCEISNYIRTYGQAMSLKLQWIGLTEATREWM